MTKTNNLKFSFLVIAFNADDFLYESLKSVYDFAHEIFIVEGAVREAWPIANADGSSTDRTNEILINFPDPAKKLTIIHGKWRNKEQMTNIPLKYVTGDYIWRLDADEVYKKNDLVKISSLLKNKPEITHVTIRAIDLFHGFNRIAVRRDGQGEYQADRIWKFKPGCYFKGHRPPDLFCPSLNKFMGKGPTITGEILEKKYGITYYHYSYITDKQVKDKMFIMTNIYLRHFAFGIPFWRIIRYIPVIKKFYRLFFSLPIFDNMRKRLAFREVNFDYYNTVWLPWINNRIAVEKKYSISPRLNYYCITTPFYGQHPETIEKKIKKTKYDIFK